MSLSEKLRALAVQFARTRAPRNHVDRLGALAAEAEALERDAERYRWLRDIGDKTWTPLLARARSAFPHVPERELPSMVDEIISGAIDAALAKEQP